MKKKTKIAFLDRDGVINNCKINDGYIGKISDFKWLPGSKRAIQFLKLRKYKVIIVTNQSGVARGYFSIKDVYKSKYPIVTFSNKMKEFDKKIKFFLRKKMYYHKNVKTNTNRGKKIIKKLFISIKKNPNKYVNVSKYDKSNIARSICDFIAGMTDRYAINLYNKIK